MITLLLNKLINKLALSYEVLGLARQGGFSFYWHCCPVIYVKKITFFMFIMITPVVKPVNVKEYDFRQSKYEIAPRLPFSQIIIGPSGSGKGILLQSMILDIYRDVFARIYIWSPSIAVDSNWTPVKKIHSR